MGVVVSPAGVGTGLGHRVDGHGQERGTSGGTSIGVTLGGDAELVQSVVEVLSAGVVVALVADVDTTNGGAMDSRVTVDLVLAG